MCDVDECDQFSINWLIQLGVCKLFVIMIGNFLGS